MIKKKEKSSTYIYVKIRFIIYRSSTSLQYLILKKKEREERERADDYHRVHIQDIKKSLH